MKLIPYHQFEIMAALSRTDALAAIASRLEERKWFRVTAMGAANDERFDGSVTGNRFEFTRIMGYRNSFAPVVEGEVHDGGRFSRVVVTMRPSVIVFVFLPVFALIFFAAFFAIEGGAFWPALLAPVLIYAGVLGGFWFEANKIEQTLRRILKAM